MDGMCQMMGGMACGWTALLALLVFLALVVALIVAIVALTRRGGSARPPAPPA